MEWPAAQTAALPAAPENRRGGTDENFAASFQSEQRQNGLRLFSEKAEGRFAIYPADEKGKSSVRLLPSGHWIKGQGLL